MPEAWELKPRKLTIEELERPETVLDAFFQYAPMPETRKMIWDGIKVMVTGSFHRLPTTEQCNLIYFFEQLEKLVEGVNVLHTRASTR